MKRVELKIATHLAAREAAERRRLEAEGQHEEAEKSRPADLVRTLTSRGTTTLKATWVGVIDDREELDLEALRPYLPFEALEKALRAFVRAGGRELAGAEIYQDRKALIK